MSEDTINIFEQATRQKLRFSHKGTITVEDLWDLSDDALDSIYTKLNKQKQEQTSGGLINRRADKSLDIQLAVVAHVFETKRAEARAMKNAAAAKAEKQRILELIDEKGKEALAGKSIEELQAMIAD